MKELNPVGRAFNQLERDNRRVNTIVAANAGELAVAVARAVATKTPSQMSARDAAATLQSCGGFPVVPYDAKVYLRTRSHVKPNSAQRRGERIKEGKLKVLDGALVGA